MLNSKIRPRAVVGYGVKIFHPSPPNYVTRSPGDLNLEPELAVGRIISLDFMRCIGAAYLLDHESTSCLSKPDKICGLKDSRTRILSIFLLCKCFLVDQN